VCSARADGRYYIRFDNRKRKYKTKYALLLLLLLFMWFCRYIILGAMECWRTVYTAYRMCIFCVYELNTEHWIICGWEENNKNKNTQTATTVLLRLRPHSLVYRMLVKHNTHTHTNTYETACTFEPVQTCTHFLMETAISFSRIHCLWHSVSEFSGWIL
jgi:hypothetical protein